MDPSAFDSVARAIAQSGTRRWLVRLVATLPLGVLTRRGADEAAAERPIDRVQGRTPQRNRKQRNTKNTKNKNRNNLQAHKSCNDFEGIPLGNRTCLTPCFFPNPPDPVHSGAVCPLPEAVCSGNGCHGDCCTLGIDRKLYCSLGEPSSVSCSRLDDCPKGQFCTASNDCRVACVAS